jgi:hypothetical protein
VEPAPTATDWVTAISTAGAFLAAVVAALIAGIVLRHDREARRAEQASRLAAWVEWRTGSDPGLGWWACVLLNTSRLPVFDVVLSYRLYYADGDTVGGGTDRLYLLAPGKHEQRVPDRVTRSAESLFAELEKTRVQISFTDAAGGKWRRGADGQLSERRPPRRPIVRPEDLVTHVTRCPPPRK